MIETLLIPSDSNPRPDAATGISEGAGIVVAQVSDRRCVLLETFSQLRTELSERLHGERHTGGIQHRGRVHRFADHVKLLGAGGSKRSCDRDAEMNLCVETAFPTALD